MTKEMITIHNAETGEVIKREMTKAEADLLATDQAEAQGRKQADASKAIEKAALLAKLGITELEAALLLS